MRATHIYQRAAERQLFFNFLLEANACLWSLALPSSEYLLNFCLKKRWQDWDFSIRSETVETRAEESRGWRDAGVLAGPPSSRGWAPGWRPGWKLNWCIWDSASGLFSVNRLGLDSSVSSSCLCKMSAGVSQGVPEPKASWWRVGTYRACVGRSRTRYLAHSCVTWSLSLSFFCKLKLSGCAGFSF